MKVKAVVFFVITLFLMLAVLSYNRMDSAVLSGGIGGSPHNWIGHAGAWCSIILFHLIGVAAYLVPLMLLIRSLRIFTPGAGKTSSFCGGMLLVLAGCVLLFGLAPEPFAPITDYLGLGRRQVPQLALSGGVIGQVLAAPAFENNTINVQLSEGLLRQFIGAPGTMIIAFFMLAGGLVIIYISDWHNFLSGRDKSSDATEKRRRSSYDHPAIFDNDDDSDDDSGNEKQPKRNRLLDFLHRSEGADEQKSPVGTVQEQDGNIVRTFDFPEPEQALNEIKHPTEQIPQAAAVRTTSVEELPLPRTTSQPSAPQAQEVDTRPVAQGKRLSSPNCSDFVLPPITMLAKGSDVIGENSDAIEKARARLQGTLEEFNIPGKVTGYITGPRVTRFEITLDPGVNVKKVEAIQDNIKMNLETASIRVLAPIPGRPVVGIEVSNTKAEAVHMRSVMESDAWKNTRMAIPLAVGKDVSGKPVVFDLGAAPQLLIAGTTGTGKSVCTNSLIISLLFRFTPDELKLIMVDPKIVEFEDYKRLPHLLTPIINDPAKVPIALRWAANEMDKRYRQLAKAGVKKLAEYNSRPIGGEPVIGEDGKPLPDRLPYLVIIIDELADLMMTEAKKDVETSICRIAQKGRAAGVHLVLATQRPSTNIITGVIKANLPSRFCFQVRSGTDSRVVVDENGAEKLLGKGDMLLMSPNSMNIERVQGAFVEDKDIKGIVKFVSDQAPQHFNDNILIEESPEADDDDDDTGTGVSAFDDDDVFDDMDRAEIAPIIKKYLQPGDDENFKRAMEIVILDRKVSTSYLQRRLKIGYNTAATITQKLEDRGIIGPDTGSGKKRDILIFDGMSINQS